MIEVETLMTTIRFEQCRGGGLERVPTAALRAELARREPETAE